ncbi:MAG: ABC transporter permease subunit [Eubacteriales bacterium]|nr:ABC transporter permease subunit [Eubacteriales bacterium]
MQTAPVVSGCVKRSWYAGFIQSLRRNWILYAFLVPTLAYLIIFQYWPLYGVQIAFRKFTASKGIWGSAWVGMQNFEKFFNSYMFKDLLVNTVVLSVYQLIAAFPFPIILALMLNYSVSNRLRRATQMVTYAPHFISTVVLVGMMSVFMGQTGLFNTLLGKLGIGPVAFLSDSSMFRDIYVWSHIWQRTGYNSVIYIAALASVSPELHEAAIVDGANKLQRIWHVDIPAILPTAVILLIMSTGNVLSLGFEKVYLMQNDLNLNVAEIISTYVYKIGLLNAQYSYSTAIGLFNNIVNLVILLSVNKLADRLSGTSLL